MYRLGLIILSFSFMLFSCTKEDEVVGNYKIEKFNPERIDNMYTSMHIKEDNTFELRTEDNQNVIEGEWRLRWNSIFFKYDGNQVEGKLKDYEAFIVNSPDDFHSGHFSIILYVKID